MKRRCAEVCGDFDGSQVLYEVLSYFPEVADNFIMTQEYALKFTKKKGIYYNIQHSKDGIGLDNTTVRKGDWEHLGTHHTTGQSIFELIQTIRHLYDGKIGGLEKVLSAADDNGDRVSGQMLKKTLEIMGITPDIISAIRATQEVHDIAQAKHDEAHQLEKTAKKLREDANTLAAEASGNLSEFFALKKS